MQGLDAVLDSCTMGQVATVLVDPGTAMRTFFTRPADHPGLVLGSTGAEASDVRGDLGAAVTGADATFVGSATLGDAAVAALLRT